MFMLVVWFLGSIFFVIIFQKENGNTSTLLFIFIVKSLQKEQNSTNLLLWPPICRNKPAITPKWFNSLDTNSNQRTYVDYPFCPDYYIYCTIIKMNIFNLQHYDVLDIDLGITTIRIKKTKTYGFNGTYLTEFKVLLINISSLVEF